MITITKSEAKMLFGKHASLRIGASAREKGYKKALLMTDKGVYSSGIVDPLVENLEKSGIEVILYTGVLADPPDTMVDEAAKVARDGEVDVIIAVGGGSSIDAGKMVSVLMSNEGTISDYIIPNMPKNPAYPMIVVPTTAGTGSEFTGGAVVTVSATNAKEPVVTLCEKTVIVDPLLYVGMPLQPSIYCGFDVITHAVDSICHFDSEPISCTFAEKALRLAYKYLPKVVEDPSDIEARSEMAIAASLGGAAIGGNGCHVTHAIGHSIGAKFHLPHGLCCALALPELLRLYAKWVPKQAKIVADCLGITYPEDISVEELGEKLHDVMLKFMKDMGLKNMKELGLSLEDVLTQALPLMPRDTMMNYTPKLMGPSDFKAVLEEAYNH